MRIVGIDPGSKATGYGVIDTDGTHHRLVSQGVVRTRPKDTFAEKLHCIHAGLTEVMETCSPDEMVVESLFFALNVKSALTLGHVRGVVLLSGVTRGMPVREYAPLEVKQAVVGYGRADKSQVQKMVAVLLALDAPPASHDASDALAVALCHAHQLRYQAKVEATS